MKAVLTFKLPEEADNLQWAKDGQKYVFVLDDIREHIRGRLKWGELSEETTSELEKLYDMLFEALDFETYRVKRKPGLIFRLLLYLQNVTNKMLHRKCSDSSSDTTNL